MGKVLSKLLKLFGINVSVKGTFGLFNRTPRKLDIIIDGIYILITYVESILGFMKVEEKIYWDKVDKMFYDYVNPWYYNKYEQKANVDEIEKYKKFGITDLAIYKFITGDYGEESDTENYREEIRKSVSASQEIAPFTYPPIINLRDLQIRLGNIELQLRHLYLDTISDGEKNDTSDLIHQFSDAMGKSAILNLTEELATVKEDIQNIKESGSSIDYTILASKIAEVILEKTNGQASRDGFSGSDEGIMGSFKTGKSGLNNELHGIAQAFQTTLQNNINTVVENITGVNWEMMGMGFGRELGEGLKAFFDDLDWNEILMEDDEDIHIPIGNRLNYHEIKDIVQTVMKQSFR